MAVTKSANAVNASTTWKNSGILRYYFGISQASMAGIAGGDGVVVNCLGDDLDTTPDDDNQLFGMSPGHDAITASPGSMFGSLVSPNLVQRDNQPIGPGAGVRFPPGAPGTGGGDMHQARLQANGYVPSLTKVMAWAQMVQPVEAASTVADSIPYVAVQTEVANNALFINGTEQDGPRYIGSIRVGIFNHGNSLTEWSGVLYVMLMHSYLDIPGNYLSQFSVGTPNGGTDGGPQSSTIRTIG